MHWERGAELDPPPSMCHFWVGEQRRSLLATKVPRGGRQPGRWFALGWRSARNTGAHAHTRNGSTARGGTGEAQRDTGGITHGHLDLLALRLGGRLRGGHPWREGVALRRGKSRR